VQANRVRASLSAMFSWGMKAGLVSGNPIAATFKPSEEHARERVLSDQELGWIWSCTQELGDYGRIVRLLMLTGARRSEVGGMRESELVRHHDGSVTWTIPGERTKNRLALELMLPAWIAREVPMPGNHDTLFGTAGQGFKNWNSARARLDRNLTAAGYKLSPWVLHDLRRSFVTRLNDLDVEPHVIEALVNHVSGRAKASVAGVYNHSTYRDQKRAVLVLWADHLRTKVVPGTMGVTLRIA
jgi:integrase